MISQRLTYGSSFCAVEHANDKKFHFLQLKRKKNELILSREESFNRFFELISLIGKPKHLYLVVNNEQVLSKKIDFVHASKERVVKAAFPNIQLQDFYFEVYSNDQVSLVAICRKEEVKKIIANYQEKGISVINFSLGNLQIQSLLPFVLEKEFRTSNAIVKVGENKIEGIEKKEVPCKKYDINGLEIDSNHLLSLAGIIDYYSGKKKTDNQYQKSLQTEYQQKRFFALGLRFALGFLFLSLLINFLMFSNYRNKTSDLNTELAINESYKKQMVSLKDVVDRKKKLVESINSVSTSKVIWYVDEISKTVPTTLSLDEITYQPLIRPAREGKKVIVDNAVVFIKGISKSDSDFTKWISKLENLDWIYKVSQLNYGSKKTRKTTFDFIIEMNQKKQ